MASRDDNECAYCAGETAPEARIIGQDWKVYCREECAELGAAITAGDFVCSRTEEERHLPSQAVESLSWR
jgi:hypothetical protein